MKTRPRYVIADLVAVGALAGVVDAVGRVRRAQRGFSGLALIDVDQDPARIVAVPIVPQNPYDHALTREAALIEARRMASIYNRDDETRLAVEDAAKQRRGGGA